MGLFLGPCGPEANVLPRDPTVERRDGDAGDRGDRVAHRRQALVPPPCQVDPRRVRSDLPGNKAHKDNQGMIQEMW